MNTPFFPDGVFAWAFYVVLVVLTLLASYTDLRWFIVPKWISVAGLALGVCGNGLRGALLGWQDTPVWLFEPSGIAAGAVDGLLFALAGFALGFGLFFAMWILSICGGGDVKLFAAVSAWVGPNHALWLLFGCTFIMLVLGIIRVCGSLASKGFTATNRLAQPAHLRGAQAREAAQAKPLSRLSTYALPLAITTALLMMWFYRYDLHLAVRATPGTNQPIEGNANHAKA